ncbi:IS110 family transposase [Syntrophobacter fumaroxidans]|uniref:Transposase IS116/IS110/IS902 family protein n=1 Tax=Syntrophobacter fumaroxidans (strain DSM 10017 / MPOB) TaxID=335543 RepID=A0LEX8_SYNFM|nr:IS110 family transposase [Syntrophobacter fumaroxidans]ABK15980.1 transposase IS116/IS110/IS902 family protein [Syntrophobacter fumaroxidans MPOB]ABK16556.1 transposase IS116/IS110/IS902 family protein [Syntrophobacter fumaroxidans MPOB]ABK18278.1 transposase IS116/IS110/IS902 family protein [Syntrophobacter fumaroxidans MPOB]
MGLYAGIDLHASSNYLAIVDESGKRTLRCKLPNDGEEVVSALEPYRDQMMGVAVESTFNWYWLVDTLNESGLRVHLANPAAIQKYSGLKHCDDKYDAFWLAEMLRLGILPEGYIYPKEERPLRDLLRKRGHLVKLRTSLILSLQNIVARNRGLRVNANEVKRLKKNRIPPLLEENEDLAMAGRVSKETIDFLTRMIRDIEIAVARKTSLKDSYRNLLTIPGIGRILALTIMLETGPIGRFPKVGNYVSYCRKVGSRWTSNEKAKGKGNKKNGNKYLAWAFSEAAELARRFDPECRSYYNRKMHRSNFLVAHQALAHKLARAAYYLMKDNVVFMPEKLFGRSPPAQEPGRAHVPCRERGTR